MITTNLVELLRDISLQLGVLIKTSELPRTSTSLVNISNQQPQQVRNNNINKTDTNQQSTSSVPSSFSSSNHKRDQESSRQIGIIDNQLNKTTPTITEAISPPTPPSSSLSPSNLSSTNQQMSQPMATNDLDLNPNDSNNNSSQNYNYLYNNKSSNCNSNTRASTGSILEHDEVRSVIVTGCGSKIGRKIATAFARLDFNIALVDFNIKQTEFVAEECQEASPKNRVPLQIIADISQLDEAHKVIDQAVKQFGRLDVLVNTINNAALMEAHFTGGQSDDDPHVFEQYHRIIANNMHSVTYLCISAAPHLRRSKGSIVNVSSISENDHGSYKFAYCMSKAGIWTLTKCLATDYAPDINMICVSDQPTSATLGNNKESSKKATFMEPSELSSSTTTTAASHQRSSPSTLLIPDKQTNSPSRRQSEPVPRK